MSVVRVDHLPQLDGCQTLTVQVSMLRHCIRSADLSRIDESRPSDISLDSLLAEQQVMHINSFSVQVCACRAAFSVPRASVICHGSHDRWERCVIHRLQEPSRLLRSRLRLSSELYTRVASSARVRYKKARLAVIDFKTFAPSSTSLLPILR